ncbi:MAG TPA: aldo/keto reductase [Dehalococcoidia bacterium]|nr:aldo/keto reductase [Dehalococcoidia bacterium]
MQYRKLGRTGLKVSELCLGSDNFGNPFGATPETSFQIMDRALDFGVNFIDTADQYADGNSETVIGEYLSSRKKRDDVVLATKFWTATGPGPNDYGTSRYHLMNAVEASLKRLQTDHIDLYLIHAPDMTTPLEETLETLTDLRRAGKVRYIGVSNFPAWLLMEGLWASDVKHFAPFDCIQSGYNILRPGFARDVLELCVDQGVGATAYSPMASGMLTGKHDRKSEVPDADTKFGDRDASRGGALVRRYWNEAMFDVVDMLGDLAEKSGNSIMRLALQWVRESPGITSAIVGARREDHIEGIIDAWSEDASADVMAEVRRIADDFAAKTPSDYPPPFAVPALGRTGAP